MPVEIGEIDTNVEVTPSEGGTGSVLTPELIRKIADLVMEMMRQELKYEYERRRMMGSAGGSAGGSTWRVKGVR